VHDAGSGLVYMQQRYYDPEVGRFLSIDPVGVDTGNGGNFNRYWYGNDNPYRYVDQDGRWAEDVLIGGPSLALGLSSFHNNVSEGNFLAAVVDAAGIVLDSLAIAVPGAPGGVGLGIKAARVADTARIADDSLVVRGGSPANANSPGGIAAGTSTRGDNGITGFSAESANAASLCELCANVPNNQVGVTTAGQVRAAGGEVTATPGRSPNHATVSGLTPEAASEILTPMRNPVPKAERTKWD